MSVLERLTRKEKEMKLTKTRTEIECHKCKSKIAKGNHYAKKSITIGRPQDSAMEMIDGIPTMVEMGFRTTVKVCEVCSQKPL
jgi:DNA-directed RNA polymerase subunit RPC12/RpoP